jgi:hypothetical protein
MESVLARRGFLWLAILCLATAASLLTPAPALASGAGPNGINIGFDFNWNNGPQGYTASSIASVTGSGATLNNCTPGPDHADEHCLRFRLRL